MRLFRLGVCIERERRSILGACFSAAASGYLPFLFFGRGWAAFRKNPRLSMTDVDCGAFEILWRLLPPLTVYVPSSLLNFTAQLAVKGELNFEEQ